MKATKYWFDFSMDDQTFLYNAMTNALAIIEQDKLNSFKQFVSTGAPITDERLINDLREGGFLVEDDYDEIKMLRMRLLSSRFNSSSFGMTLAPTSDCNLRCIYCYERDVLRPSYMKKDVQDAIVQELESRAQNIRSFSVSWYGGEPLLALDIIRELSNRFIQICDEHNIVYSAGIITNGYLLTPDVVTELTKYHVNFYQITIDGTRETHNKSRPLRNGNGTYDRIFENLQNCIDLLPMVSLRINVSKNNVTAINDISDKICALGLEKKVKPYLGKITNDTNDPILAPICFSTEEFSKVDLAYTMSHVDTLDWFQKYPSLKGHFCGADASSGVVVDSDGEMYRCWNEIGNTQFSIGNIVTGAFKNQKHFFDYMDFDPTHDLECSTCKVLPLCMGGCPYHRLIGDKDGQCSEYKENLKEYLMAIARQILLQKEKDFQESNKQ